jgi:predicted house-cleaning noncanonical NTP pyrophosphatase (MazG superfamily)
MAAKTQKDRSDLIFDSYHFSGKTSPVPTFDLIGQKGVGLTDINFNWTLPFSILTTKVFDLWKADYVANSGNKASQIIKKLITDIVLKFNRIKCKKVIVRSSAKFESLDERGIFESYKSNLSVDEIYGNIVKIWSTSLRTLSDSEKIDNKLAIIIQQFNEPLRQGHLSNERRISKKPNEWLLESDQSTGALPNKKFITKPLSNNKFLTDTLKCRNLKELYSDLKKIAFLFEDNKFRWHLEWIWDKDFLWIVQKDKEELYEGKEPGSLWSRKELVTKTPDLKIIIPDSKSSEKWAKIEHIRVFRECGFKTYDFFILEDRRIFDGIIKGKEYQDLNSDLSILTESPIVIRTSLKIGNSSSHLMLPRTETIFNKEEAIIFIKQVCINFKNQGVDTDQYAFLIHKFIISKSCALVLAEPKNNKVGIDSSWGLADGLGYNSYDSFEIDIRTRKIRKKIRGKTEYLDVNEKGNWIIKKAGYPWDWRQSLGNKDLYQIADMSSKLAIHLKTPVIIMYFIGDGTSVIHPKILAWHYNTTELPSKIPQISESFFSIKNVRIINKNSFQLVKENLLLDGRNSKIILKLKLDTDLLRETEFIKEIGDYAIENNYYVELEGSSLSHAYYVLSNGNVKIKCVDQFEPKYRNKEFNKLVRDKVPTNIASHGESVIIDKIRSEDLIFLLKSKAVEEALELFYTLNEKDIKEELADILEVIRTLCILIKIDFKEIQDIADSKKIERGGFEEGIFLRETQEVSIRNSNKIQSRNKRSKSNYDENEWNIPIVPTQPGIRSIKPFYSKSMDCDVYINYSVKGIRIMLKSVKKNYQNPNQLTLYQYFK